MIEQPPKRLRDAALKTARHYLWTCADAVGSRHEMRLSKRLDQHAEKIAAEYRRRNSGLQATAEQVRHELIVEAQKRGPLAPFLGKDL